MWILNRRRTLTPLVFLFSLFVFFWNLNVLYSKQACLDQITKLEEDKGKIFYELKKAETDRDNALFRLKSFKKNDDRSNGQEEADIIPVIVFCYNRPIYLERTLNNLLKYTPIGEENNFPIFVSQDADDPEVTQLIKRFPQVFHIQHKEREKPVKKHPSEIDSYYYISQHYKFGFHILFDILRFKTAIILEDDMDISPDFFDYFMAMLPILKSDPTLFCVSAWNDNGLPKFVKDPEAVYRSNFFPGLGWMLTRNLWDEFSSKWPGGYWDDWIREPEQRKERDCIRPEISRTHTFGEKGSSSGQFYGQFLKDMVLNDAKINWKEKDLSFLYKKNYDVIFDNMLANAIPIKQKEEATKYINSTLVMYYKDFQTVAKVYHLMDDTKAGIPRTAYKGVIQFRENSNTILLAPQSPQK